MKKAGVRERIIDTASRLFYEKGYNQTGINLIISEAGVAKASLYQHFRSKEEIALAYLDYRDEISSALLQECLEGIMDYKARILAQFDCLENFQRQRVYKGCHFQNIVSDLPKDHALIRQRSQKYKDKRRMWIIEELRQCGKYSDKEAEELGNQIMVLVEGSLIMSKIQHDAWPILTAKDACKKLLNI